jgi:Skp family chaperone for outer membrane proteins
MRNEIERLSQMNKEKDERIRYSEIEIKSRTAERDQALEQYGYINEQFLSDSEDGRPRIGRLKDIVRQKQDMIQGKEEETEILRRELQRVTAFSSQKDRNFLELRDESSRLVAELRAEIKEKEKNLDNMEAAAQALISRKDEVTKGLRERSRILTEVEQLTGRQKEKNLYREDIFVSEVY